MVQGVGPQQIQPGEAAVELRGERGVVRRAGHGGVEDFEGHRRFVVAEEADRSGDLLEAGPVGRVEVSEDRRCGHCAAHAADTPLTRAAAAE